MGELWRYRPWLTVFDVPSKGLRTRVRGIKARRTHHLLSLLELMFFFLAEFNDSVLDIREQYPLLPQGDTLEIAKQLGIKHPVDPVTKYPIVLTTDFLLTVRHGASDQLQAWSVKYLRDLAKPRTLEKEELQRRRWHQQGISWRLFTERDITPTQARNIRYLFPFRKPRSLRGIPHPLIRHLCDYLYDHITDGSVLADVCSTYEERYLVSRGTALMVSRYLLANKHWPLNLSHVISPLHPLVFRSSSPQISPKVAHAASQECLTRLA